MTTVVKMMQRRSQTTQQNNNNSDFLFPPLTYSRWTQWLLKDTSEDCIIHNNRDKSPSSSSRTTSTSSSTAPSSTLQQHQSNCHQTASTATNRRNNMELIQLLAINALEFTAPVYSFLNKDTTPLLPSSSSTSASGAAAAEEPTTQKKQDLLKKTSTELKLEREFIQLSGHPGSFAPAGPNSLWKKLPNDSQQEALIYEHLKSRPLDPFTKLIPHFISHTKYNSTDFIELEDLVTRFDIKTVNIMDIKLGTRTFLESEVSNTSPRPDLFAKMYKIDPTAPTEEELADKSITKLRYMLFREHLSSTSTLGFRLEGIKLSPPRLLDDPTTKICTTTHFPTVKDEPTISRILSAFTSKRKGEFIHKLVQLRDILESSEFFRTHEMIGSSLLLIHDDDKCNIWVIDFAKTSFVSGELSHRKKWELGNREDGVLMGVDNLIRLLDTDDL